MELLKCEALTLGYDGNPVARDISFTVASGDYLCMIGENGSGKSTLMKAILGLHRQIGGTVTFTGGLKQEQIGYLPQQTELQKDFPASVWEVVRSGCLNRCGIRPFYTRSQREAARKNMEKMHITHLAKRCYRELSGGQQQRVLLARALCATQKLLLLDEPTAGLDPQVTRELYAAIRELNDDGITVIMISHDLDAALTYASHILHMGSGFFGTKDAYLAHMRETEGGEHHA